MSVIFEGPKGREVSLEAEEASGYFSAFVEGARAGDRYRLRLDGEGQGYPDPAPSRPRAPGRRRRRSYRRWPSSA
ncbi:MAG: hypothetical protein MUF34_28730 [Polyangiaceae bacterium]|nr:hypothetical protein [Polyangiaceae bacterium]